MKGRWPNAGNDLSFLVSDGGYRDLDARFWFFTDYYSISPGMVSMTPGKGAFYMIAFEDADGHALDGDITYQSSCPPTSRRGCSGPSRSTRPRTPPASPTGGRFPRSASSTSLRKNSDGSTEL